MKANERLCIRCQRLKKGPKHHLWTCRRCGHQVCEHLCGFKAPEAKATCTACQIRAGWARKY